MHAKRAIENQQPGAGQQLASTCNQALRSADILAQWHDDKRNHGRERRFRRGYLACFKWGDVYLVVTMQVRYSEKSKKYFGNSLSFGEFSEGGFPWNMPNSIGHQWSLNSLSPIAQHPVAYHIDAQN